MAFENLENIDTEVNGNHYENVTFEGIDFNKNVPEQICEILYKYEIQSVIIEGGKKTLQSFINANLWDEAYVFKGVINFEKGLKAPELESEIFKKIAFSNDVLEIYKNQNN